MKEKFSGAYSRRRFSNYAASQGDQDVESQNKQYTLNVGAVDPSMGTVEKVCVSIEDDFTSSGLVGNNEYPDTKGTSSSTNSYRTYKITANPFTGYRFVSWNGLPSGYNRQQNPIDVKLDRNLDITANFTKVNIAYHVDVDWDVSMGTVSASQAMNGGSITVNTGDSVTLHAQPKAGFKFVRWDGVNLAGNTQDNSSEIITLTINRDLSLKAVFAAEDPADNEHNEDDENSGDGGSYGGGSYGGNGGGGSYGGEEPVDGGSSTETETQTGILALAKKYWWIIAAVVVYYFCKKGGKK